MPGPAALPIALTVGGKLLDSATQKKPSTTPSTPADLQPMRAQQISLLQYLLGMGPDPRAQATPQMQAADFQQGFNQAKAGGPKGIQQYLQSHPASSFANPAPVSPNYQEPTYANAAPWIPHMAQGGVMNYEAGGPVVGPGGPTSDAVPAQLSNGEGVLTAETVKNLGGPDVINELNAALGAPGAPNVGPMLQQFLASMQSPPPAKMANGGMVQQPPQTPTPTHPQFMAGGGIAGSPLINPMPDQQPVSMAPQMGTSPTMDPAPNNIPAISGQSNSGGVQSPQQRLESFFGPLGMYASPLQQQAGNAMSQYLNQPTPESRAMNTSLPQLTSTLNGGNGSTQGAINGLMGLQTGAGADVEGRLGQLGQRPVTGTAGGDTSLQSLMQGNGTNPLQGLGQAGYQPGISGYGSSAAQGILQGLASSNPGQGVVNALNPVYEHNLSQANLTGGRFGSANALQKAQALNDFNLAAQQAMQRGVDQQITAANNLGNLDLGFNQTGASTALGARGQDTQTALANAGNQLSAGQSGIQNQLAALGLGIQGAQGLDTTSLNALSQLGGLRLQGQQLQGNNLQNAGQLGLGQGQLSNNAAGILGQLASNTGSADRANQTNAFNAGTTQTQQGYVGQQNTLNLLQQLLGQAQGASIGGPVIQNQNTNGQYGDAASGLLQYLAAMQRPGAGTTPQPYTSPTGG